MLLCVAVVVVIAVVNGIDIVAVDAAAVIVGSVAVTEVVDVYFFSLLMLLLIF